MFENPVNVFTSFLCLNQTPKYGGTGAAACDLSLPHPFPSLVKGGLRGDLSGSACSQARKSLLASYAGRPFFTGGKEAGPQRVSVCTRLLGLDLVVLWVFFCLFAPLWGCKPVVSRPSPQTLVVGLESSPTTLDPRYATDATSSRIGRLLFRSLLRLDSNFRYVPDLAERWQVKDPLTYIFFLRPGIVFHNGIPLTSEDVKATYTAILDPVFHSPKREALSVIEAIDTPDPLTIVFHLRETNAPFLEAALLGVLPRELAITPPSEVERLIGAGPFRLIHFVPDTEVILSRDPLYTPHPARLEQVVFKIVPDGTVRALELKKGGLHFVQNGIEPDVVPWLQERAGLEVLRSPGTSFQYLGMNLRDPRLQDRRVRQAIALAIDRQAVIRYLLKGFALPATGLLPPSHWAYEPEVQTHPHDPFKARALLDKAGYPDPDGLGPLPRFRLSYKTTTVDLRRRIAEAFQEQLAQVGIALDIRTYEWGTFYADIRKGNFHLYSLAWVGINDPDIYYAVFHSRMTPPQGNNRGFYLHPRIDTLTEVGRRTLDRRERGRIYSEVQKLIAEDLPYIPLWWTTNVVVKDKRVKGFVPHPSGDLFSFTKVWIEE